MLRNRFTYSFKDLMPSVSRLEEVMGYKTGNAPETVTLLLKEVIEEVIDIEEARAEYVIIEDVNFSQTDRSISITNSVFAIKSIIFNQIKKAESIALFICTAGETISSLSRFAMTSNDLLRGYIYDVVGSEIVEAAADRMQDELSKHAQADRSHITNRFSPGYCGWDVAEQRSLFKFFPDNFCGITLTESALMSPVKSVSGIIGIGREVRFSEYHCKLCSDNNCIYRYKK